MRILEMSDLHLEFNSDIRVVNDTKSNVLVLAGDIFVADYFTKTEASPKFAAAKNAKDFFHIACQEFDHVIYVLGNHEHYFGTLKLTVDILKNALPYSNLHILDNQYIDIEGFRFLGSTMWTDCRQNNPVTKMVLSGYLNDFKLIKYKKIPYEKFTPDSSIIEHTIAKQFISDNLSDSLRNIVITHHGPSWLSIDRRYDTPQDFHGNGGYVSGLEEFILDRNIELWFHGHIHNNKDYLIGDTRIICNPHGYRTENLTDFLPNNIIDL